MEFSAMEQKQRDRSLYTYAADLMQKGVSNSDVVKDLDGKGIPRDEGWALVERIYADRIKQRRCDGLKLIAISSLILFAAAFVAATTYMACGVGVIAVGIASVSRTQLAEGVSDFFS